MPASHVLPDPEIRELIKLARTGDIQARNRVIEANYGLLYRHASSSLRRTKSNFFTHDDLANEGVFGIIKAIDKYDFREGCTFSTYASYWIMNAIQFYRMTKSDGIKKPREYGNLMKKYDLLKNKGISDSEIASLIGIGSIHLNLVKKTPRPDHSKSEVDWLEIATSNDNNLTKEYMDSIFVDLDMFERKIVDLKIEGFSSEEISKLMNMKKSAVASNFGHAIRKIRIRDAKQRKMDVRIDGTGDVQCEK